MGLKGFIGTALAATVITLAGHPYHPPGIQARLDDDNDGGDDQYRDPLQIVYEDPSPTVFDLGKFVKKIDLTKINSLSDLVKPRVDDTRSYLERFSDRSPWDLEAARGRGKYNPWNKLTGKKRL